MVMANDIFISYARPDETKARGIAHALAQGGIACWIDREGIRFGESYNRSSTRRSAMRD